MPSMSASVIPFLTKCFVFPLFISGFYVKMIDESWGRKIMKGIKLLDPRRLIITALQCLDHATLIFESFCNWSTGKEATLAIIKPDGLLGNYTDAIKTAILRSGFKISREKIVQLDEESAASFYIEHSTKRFFRGLVEYMTSGPALVMVLEKENAVSDWRTLIGPTDGSKAKITHPDSIRAMCGTDVEKNCVHGADSTQSAEREAVTVVEILNTTNFSLIVAFANRMTVQQLHGNLRIS